jgi:hypothetical protein
MALKNKRPLTLTIEEESIDTFEQFCHDLKENEWTGGEVL